jgi:hypothetical protein
MKQGIGAVFFFVIGVIELILGFNGQPQIRWGEVWMTPEMRELFGFMLCGLALWMLIIAAKQARTIKKNADAEPEAYKVARKSSHLEPQRSREMNLKTRYIIAGIFITSACVLWLFSAQSVGARVLSIILICAPSWFIDPRQMTKPIHFGLPKWIAKKFFTETTILLVFILTVILFWHTPEHGSILMGKWYFTGTFWLCYLSAMARRYYQEKEKSQPTSPGDSLKAPPEK